MPTLLPCPRCATPFPADLLAACPTCGCSTSTAAARPLPAALALLGLSLAGCPRTNQIEPQPEYGVPITDPEPQAEYGAAIPDEPEPAGEEGAEEGGEEGAEEGGAEGGGSAENEGGAQDGQAQPPPPEIIEVRPLYGVAVPEVTRPK